MPNKLYFHKQVRFYRLTAILLAFLSILAPFTSVLAQEAPTPVDTLAVVSVPITDPSIPDNKIRG